MGTNKKAKRRRHTSERDRQRPLARPRRRRLWLFRLLAVGGAVGGALILGEITVYVFDVGPEIAPVYADSFQLSGNPVLRYELLPGSEYLGGTINADGMRDRDYAREKPPNTFRIACLGDSICFGYDVGPTETFAGRLEEYLNRYFGSPALAFEVLNFGVTGYNITQVVENVRVRALKYNPDLIIYAYSVNDPQDFSIELDALRAQLNTAQRNYLDRWRRGATRLALKSRLYVLTRYLLEARTSAGREKGTAAEDPEWSSLWAGTYEQFYSELHQDGPRWRRVVRGLTALGAISRVRRIPTYVVIFPVLRDFGAYPLHHVHQKVTREARRHSLRVLEMLPAYAALSQVPGARFARDFLHPDAPGYAYAAVVMLRELLLRAELPVPDRDIHRLAAEDTLEGEFARLLLQRFPARRPDQP